MNNDAFSKDGITMIKRESLLCVYIDTRVCVLKSGKIIISDLELAFHLRPLTLMGEKEKNMNMNKRNRPIERVSTCRRGDDVRRENGRPGNNMLSNIVVNPVSISITGAIKISVPVSITKGSRHALYFRSCFWKRRKKKKRKKDRKEKSLIPSETS